MAKGNLFLGQARGKIGDIVLTHVNGVQVSRPRNRKPKNPQTPLQLLQRVVMKTTSSAYAFMQELCNHSFQGFPEGTPCQSRFSALNVGKFRQQLAEPINSGSPEVILSSTDTNFLAKNDSGCEINPYIISEGTLPSLEVQYRSYTSGAGYMVRLPIEKQGVTTPTYQDIVDMLGGQRGDQLTFIWLTCDDHNDGSKYNGYYYARVILEPSDGDMTHPFVSSNGIVLTPNARNKGNVSIIYVSGGWLFFTSNRVDDDPGAFNSVAAGTVIWSRMNQAGNTWMRSTQSLIVRADNDTGDTALERDHHMDYLGDAVQSYMTEENSTLYLNQATRSF
jgi:hypothetical protein